MSRANEYKLNQKMKKDIGLDKIDGPVKKYAQDHEVDLDDPSLITGAHLIMHIPWTPYGISKELLPNSDKDILLLVPSWEDDRVEALFRKTHQGIKNPQIAAQQREFLVEHFRKLDWSKKEDPRENAPIATATALLFRHSQNENDVHQIDNSLITDVEHMALLLQKYTRPLSAFNPVPKNWIPSVEESGRLRRRVQKCLEGD